MQDLSIVIPIKNPPDLDAFVMENKPLLASKAHKIIVDSGGGDAFKDARNLGMLPLLYEFREVSFWEARKIGYENVVTPFVLNLDADTVLQIEYVNEALGILRKGKAEALAIDYLKPQGHYAFGTSIWKTDVLRKLYDFSMTLASDGQIVKVGPQTYSTLNNGWCECLYMWQRLNTSGGRLETLPYRAKHLKL